MIMQERLEFRIQLRFDREWLVEAHTFDLADHRSVHRQALPQRCLRVDIQPAGGIPFIE